MYMYLNTLIIPHKSCNMLSILNVLTLQKKLQNFVTNNVFMDKKVNTQQQQNIEHKYPCRSQEMNPRPIAPTESSKSNDCFQAIRLFTCFDGMGRNVHKQSQATHFQ